MGLRVVVRWMLVFLQELQEGQVHCSALDAGGVACGEKLNRSLCSLKIK